MVEQSLPLSLRLGIWWSIYVEYRLQNFGPVFSKRWHHRAVCWLGDTIYRTRRWFQGARSVETTDLEGTAGMWHAGPSFWIAFDGACPVQGDGEIDGRACYYRSRGEGWQFHVAAPGKDSDGVFDDDAWVYSERRYCFPDGGWVSADVSVRCIRKAVALFCAGVKSE